MIRLRRLSERYGETEAVRELDVDIPTGIIAPGLLGLAVPSLLLLPLLSLLPATMRDYVPLSVPPTLGRQSTANIVLGVAITLPGAATLGVAALARRFGYLPHTIAGGVVVVAVACRLLAGRIRDRPLRVAE